ncbi:MAG: secondary thiamine-phosphate synthase enzyme YjbQ [Spirochaetaceae bacterium]|jgi:secondary thiamine-phosphate synthase enzyme|nr:secondary thiamine-phosphate synthase enzyme YjbQ [Spirochaetaceae bacterium]
MITKLYSFSVQTKTRNEWLNITDKAAGAIASSGVKEGLCVLFTPHTTAAVTINENADPDVPRDAIMALNSISPDMPAFKHSEGNSDAHVKTALVGPSITIIVTEGRLLLGVWQGLWFTEFDGPRTRKFFVRVIGE